MKLPIKDPVEKKLIRFEFAGEIEEGVTIALLERAVSAVAGTDPSPEAILDGVAIVDNVNRYGLQVVQAGVDGCDYEIRMLATDSNGLKHLIVGTLPVRTLH